MSKQITNEAATVDAKGIVHNTIADNIRSYNNSPEQKSMDLKAMLDILYPIGSTFIGTIPEKWLSVTKWRQIKMTQAIGYLYYNQTIPQQYWSSGLYTNGSTKQGTTQISQPTYNITILERYA